MIGVQRSDEPPVSPAGSWVADKFAEAHLVALRQDLAPSRTKPVSGCRRRYLRDCTSPGGLCLSRESISGLSCRPYEGSPAAVCTIVTTNCRRSAVVAVYNRTTFELPELAVPPKGLSDVLCRTIPSESSRIQDTADEHAAFAERNERVP
jgi:hypothetical protein